MSGRLLVQVLPRLLLVSGKSTCLRTVTFSSGTKLTRCKNPVLQLRQLEVLYSSSAAQFECLNIQDSKDFQAQVLENKTPVVVDFHATWCGPCKLLGPRLESIIGSKEGKVILAKVDVDDNPELAMKYGVRSVPTVLAVKDGEVFDQFIGCKEDDEVEGFVDKLLA